MKGEEQQVRKATEKVAQEVSEKASQDMQKIMENIMQGVLPKSALGYSDARMDAIYAQAYRLYNSGKYDEACSLFRLLVVLDSTDSKYSLGLAACLHMMKAYPEAVQVYTICGMIDSNNPIPHFHASDCFIHMNDQASALLSLRLAVDRAGDKPEYQVLKDRALLTIDSLRNEIAQTKEVQAVTEEPKAEVEE